MSMIGTLKYIKPNPRKIPDKTLIEYSANGWHILIHAFSMIVFSIYK